MPEQLNTVTTFLNLSEALEIDPAAYADVLHAEVEQIEYPNLMNRTLQRRSFDDIIEHIRAGRELMVNPRFEMQKAQVCADNSIIVEGYWHATLATDIGSMVRGQKLSAQFCVLFELRDNKIIQQRTYACYDHV
ncbi:nuclear transport factor 2 family protein [Hymenobacter metallicola]|nr:nuclear transport factor 2 family protein [Hymenobacter metallicola]